MLSKLNIRHFKCFEKLDLPLAPLTLLSGSNASGKSSVMQTLVLLHQTISEHEWSTRLMLNGESVRLGTVQDIVDKIYGRREIEIGLVEDSMNCRWIFNGDREEMSMATESIIINNEAISDLSTLHHLLPPDRSQDVSRIAIRLQNLTYITAEREGPREVYSLEDRQAARFVGPRGEHTLSVLYRIRDEPTKDSLLVKDVPRTGLKQVEARMSHFFPGCRLNVQLIPQANAVTLGIRTSDDTDFHRPIHVGFGLTQVLPIVVAAISAENDDILLIENPEVHLHPSAQALMGFFLAEVASSGTQVIVETHSDHVLNGIRRAVKAGVLLSDQTLLHFFRPRSSDLDQVVSPTLDSSGNIDMWPEDFFDQFDKDMNHFAGWDE